MIDRSKPRARYNHTINQTTFVTINSVSLQSTSLFTNYSLPHLGSLLYLRCYPFLSTSHISLVSPSSSALLPSWSLPLPGQPGLDHDLTLFPGPTFSSFEFFQRFFLPLSLLSGPQNAEGMTAGAWFCGCAQGSLRTSIFDIKARRALCSLTFAVWKVLDRLDRIISGIKVASIAFHSSAVRDTTFLPSIRIFDGLQLVEAINSSRDR